VYPQNINERDVLDFIRELSVLEEGEVDPLADFFAVLADAMEEELQHEEEAKSGRSSADDNAEGQKADDIEFLKQMAKMVAESGDAELASEMEQEIRRHEIHEKCGFKSDKEFLEWANHMAKGKDGYECVGTADPIFLLFENGMFGEMRVLEEMDIRGGDLYGLWCDVCHKNPQKFLKHIWLLASGEVKSDDVETNFACTRVGAAPKYGYGQSSIRELDNGRRNAISYVCEELDLNKYMPEGRMTPENEDKYILYARHSVLIYRIRIYCFRNNLIPPSMKEMADTIEEPTIMLTDKKTGVAKEYRKSMISDMLGGAEGKFYGHMTGREDQELMNKWMELSKRKHLPALPIMRKVPLENASMYYSNGNYKRLERLRKEYGIDDYEGMEGLIAMGHMLGLFDSKGKTSDQAARYIRDHVIARGIKPAEIHRRYGHVDLKKPFDGDFAKFFMIHHATDKEAFTDDEGVDMTSSLLANFDAVLRFRPEKKIKTNTNRERLMPKDAMAVFSNKDFDHLEMFHAATRLRNVEPGEVLIDLSRRNLSKKAIEHVQHIITELKKTDVDPADPRFKELVEILSQYGASWEELIWSMGVTDEASKVEEDKVKIPLIMDGKSDFLKIESLKKTDPRAFLSGRKTNSCSHFGGLGQERLRHAIVNPNARIMTMTTDKSYFDGLVMFDEATGIALIDNIEGAFFDTDKNDPDAGKKLVETTIRYSDALFKAMWQRKIPVSRVNLAKDKTGPVYKYFDPACEANLIKHDPYPSIYPSQVGMGSDAAEQYTVTSPEILRDGRGA